MLVPNVPFSNEAHSVVFGSKTAWGVSHAGGHWFKSSIVHHLIR